jgi:DNA-binding transcriptional LysR family regulator
MHWNRRLGGRLKLRELNILLALAQTGSMAKAAARLSISQPAISRAIADIEHTLGVRLLDRGAKGIEFNRYGRALLKRAIAVFDELNQGVQDIEFLSDPASGELHLGSGVALAEGIVQAAVERLLLQHPRVLFHIELGDTMAMYDKLRERRIEIGFARVASPPAENDMHFEALCAESLVVVAGLQSPWASRRKIKLADLVNECWIWSPRGTLVDSLVRGAFVASGLTPPSACIHTHAAGVWMGLAATGRFIAVIAPSLLQSSARRASVKVLPVELPGTQQQIGVLTLKNRTLSPLAEVFIESARHVCKQLPQQKSAQGRLAS